MPKVAGKYYELQRGWCWTLAALSMALIAGCSDTTGPKATRLEVVPSDTVVATDTKYPLRLHIFDRNGDEIPRSSYEAVYSASDKAVVRVANDSVVALLPGSAEITVSVRSSVAGVLEAKSSVTVGGIVH